MQATPPVLLFTAALTSKIQKRIQIIHQYVYNFIMFSDALASLALIIVTD